MEQVLLYQTEDGSFQVEVSLQEETVWLTQKQMSALFNKDIRTINEHIQNIYMEQELEQNSTIRKFRIVQEEGKRKVSREIEHFNLDVIISVGYRVKSPQGTQFRIWANKILKDYLLKGYTVNENRLKKQTNQIKELEKTLALFQRALSSDLNQTEASGLLSVLTKYNHSFVLLNQFDTGNFPDGQLNTNITCAIDHHSAIKAIQNLKQRLIQEQEATDLFGQSKDNSFEGILGNVVQSFGGEYLYPSIEEQAAHLLYFIIKNHPFSDGNKRIGAFIFIWFLQLNQHHLKRNGDTKINDNALVALALLVAQSDPAQKDIMIQLIINLIRDAD